MLQGGEVEPYGHDGSVKSFGESSTVTRPVSQQVADATPALFDP